MYKIYYSGILLFLFVFIVGCTSNQDNNLRVNNNSPNTPVIEEVDINNSALSSNEGNVTNINSDSKASEKDKAKKELKAKAKKKLEAKLYSLKKKLSKCKVDVEIYADSDTSYKHQLQFLKSLTTVCKDIKPYTKGYILHASRVKTERGLDIKGKDLFLPYHFSGKELLNLMKSKPQTAKSSVSSAKPSAHPVKTNARPKPLW